MPSLELKGKAQSCERAQVRDDAQQGVLLVCAGPVAQDSDQPDPQLRPVALPLARLDEPRAGDVRVRDAAR